MKQTNNFAEGNFAEGNTRTASACFLRLHVCDITQFRDDHAPMRINGPLASFGEFEREKIVLIFKLLSCALRHVFGDENLDQGILTLWIACLASCM